MAKGQIIVHADESCLGNGRKPPTPGGAACLVEAARPGLDVVRRDLWLSVPNTTNNRMALAGAVRCFELLGHKSRRRSVTYVSDSQYLVKGMREWVPAWRARAWKRRAGPIENLELWQTLVEVAAPHEVAWRWVRGHAGHPKNEFADWLAVRAAREQTQSSDFEDSRFTLWLAEQRDRGRFLEYEPDADL